METASLLTPVSGRFVFVDGSSEILFLTRRLVSSPLLLQSRAITQVRFDLKHIILEIMMEIMVCVELHKV
jgi:hypothetical protein